MNATSLHRVAATLVLALCMAAAARADAPRNTGLDQLMGGASCADCMDTECAQVELAAAEQVLHAQLRSAAGALRLGANGDQALDSLYAAQAAWERYRDLQCTLLALHEAGEADDQDVLRERCRFDFTVERILDLAEMQEELEAYARRVTQIH